jgi:hypothetical protein
MLVSEDFATVAELADREGIAPSYMTRVLPRTLPAPDFGQAILDGKPRQKWRSRNSRDLSRGSGRCSEYTSKERRNRPSPAVNSHL